MQVTDNPMFDAAMRLYKDPTAGFILFMDSSLSHAKQSSAEAFELMRSASDLSADRVRQFAAASTPAEVAGIALDCYESWVEGGLEVMDEAAMVIAESVTNMFKSSLGLTRVASEALLGRANYAGM